MEFSIRERVERGARLLDEAKPDWWQQVAKFGDLAERAMSQNSHYPERCGCVLARNYGSYWSGLDELNVQGKEFGFNAVTSTRLEFVELAILWNEQVMLRVEESRVG